MKKIIFIVFLVGLLIGISVGAKQYVGDLRPALFPAMKNKPKATSRVALGKPLDFDAKIAEGFEIGYFAENIGQVRDLAFSPGGTLVASLPSAGKIVALEDRNQDGVADDVQVLMSSLDQPHGIAFFGKFLYVAEETRVSRYLWADEPVIVARLEKKLFDLPKGFRHSTRTIAFADDGTMYVSVGSSCDTCIEKHPFLAAVIISDANGKKPEVFANGLRNSPFIAVHPETQQLWGTEMGRDFLGDSLPPDEINIIKKGGNYGWPLCYGNKVHDKKFDASVNAGKKCLLTESPIYKIPAHSAPLGLAFIKSPVFPDTWQGDLLVSYHGSWNSSVPVGYKVVHMPIENGEITGEEDFLSGLLQAGAAAARPVDLVFDKNGRLYISDDKGGNIFIVGKK